MERASSSVPDGPASDRPRHHPGAESEVLRRAGVQVRVDLRGPALSEHQDAVRAAALALTNDELLVRACIAPNSDRTVIASFTMDTSSEMDVADMIRRAILSSLRDHGELTIVFPKEPTENTNLTDLQGQYLSYIYNCSVINGRAPSEADFRDFFGTTPPTIHNMILRLEDKGLIGRVPGQPRSIRLRIPPRLLPILRPARRPLP